MMVEQLNEACPIWGEAGQVNQGNFDGWIVNSFRTDGPYRIVRSIIEQVRSLAPERKALLTTWIVDQHRSGLTSPMIDSGVLASLSSQRRLTYRQRIDRFFLMLRAYDVGLGSYIKLYGVQDNLNAKWQGITSAWLEVAKPSELSDLLAALREEGLIREEPSGMIRPSAKGLERIDSLDLAGAASDQAFVAMWFAEELDEAYIAGFTLGISDNGYRPLRIDKKEHANKIDDEIIAEIRRSRFLVADFTCELIPCKDGLRAAPRGGVYYEAGFAQGLGIPIIWTVRADCIDHVHFDTRQYAHIVWNDPADLRTKLRNRIGAVIGSRTAVHSRAN